MIRLHKRFLPIAAAVMICLLLFPIPTAAAERIDLNEPLTLKLIYQLDGTPLTGVDVSIYQIAAVDAYGEFTAVGDFANLPVDLHAASDSAWYALASTLDGYILRDGIWPTDYGKTNESGVISFPIRQKKLDAGLYLVRNDAFQRDQTRFDRGVSLVMLPSLDPVENKWNYDAVIQPKLNHHPIPVYPDEPTFTTREVLKVWKDDANPQNRPKEITVQLLQNGVVYDTVTLNASNNWRYTWDQLDNWSDWTVVEQTPAGYTVTVTQEGITFVITNTSTSEHPSETTVPSTSPSEPGTSESSTQPDTPGHPDNPDEPDKPDQPNLPQTGLLWWPVPLLAAAGLICVIAGITITRHRHE